MREPADAALVLAGSSHPKLAARVARELGTALGPCQIEVFPDGERHVNVTADVGGRRVALLQTGLAPVGEHLIELGLLADACRRSGARELVAVIPYLPYTRQDRRKQRGEALGVRVVSAFLRPLQLDRVLAFDLHSTAGEAALPVPLDELSAVVRLAQAVAARRPEGGVVVAPDLGAARLAARYARELDLPSALVGKTRTSGSDVTVERLVGDVRGRSPILVDDIISTGGTMVAAARALLAAGCRPPLTIVATHAVLARDALERLAALPIARLVVANTLPVTLECPFETQIVDVAPAIAAALAR